MITEAFLGRRKTKKNWIYPSATNILILICIWPIQNFEIFIQVLRLIDLDPLQDYKGILQQELDDVFLVERGKENGRDVLSLQNPLKHFKKLKSLILIYIMFE